MNNFFIIFSATSDIRAGECERDEMRAMESELVIEGCKASERAKWSDLEPISVRRDSEPLEIK